MSLWVCIREYGFDSEGCLLKLDAWTLFIGLGILLMVSFVAYKANKPRNRELNEQALEHVDYEENIRLLNELLGRSARVIEDALTTAGPANGISEKGTQQPETSKVDKATETESDSNGDSSNGHSSNGHTNELSSISSNGITSISSNGNSSSGSSRSSSERFRASLNYRPSRRPRLLAHPSLIRVAERNIIRNPTAVRVAGRKKYIRPRAGAFDAVYLVPRRTNGKKAANGSNGGTHKRQTIAGLTAAEAVAIRQNESSGSAEIAEGAAASGAEGAAAS